MSLGEATSGEGKGQRTIRPDSPTATEEDRGRRLGSGICNNLDNQHKVTRKFARRWFGPYVVTSANNNGTYHLAELDGTRIAIPVAGKRVKAFKKQHEDKPDLESVDSDEDRFETNGDPEDE
jgi:hypothetical protein